MFHPSVSYPVLDPRASLVLEQSLRWCQDIDERLLRAKIGLARTLPHLAIPRPGMMPGVALGHERFVPPWTTFPLRSL